MPPNSSTDLLYVDFQGARATLRAFEERAADLHRYIQQLQKKLIEAGDGDSHGYLRGGLARGDELVQLGLQAEGNLRDLIGNAYTTLRRLEQDDPGLGGILADGTMAGQWPATNQEFGFGATLGTGTGRGPKDPSSMSISELQQEIRAIEAQQERIAGLDLETRRREADRLAEQAGELLALYVELVERTNSPLEPLDEQRMRRDYWQAAVEARRLRHGVIALQKRNAELEIRRLELKLELAQRSGASEGELGKLQDALRAARRVLEGDMVLYTQPGMIAAQTSDIDASPDPILGLAQRMNEAERLHRSALGLAREEQVAKEELATAEQKLAAAERDLAAAKAVYNKGIADNARRAQPKLEALRDRFERQGNIKALEALDEFKLVLANADPNADPEVLVAARRRLQNAAGEDRAVLNQALSRILANDPRHDLLNGRRAFTNLQNHGGVEQMLLGLGKDFLIVPRIMENWRVAHSPNASARLRGDAQMELFLNALELATTVAGGATKGLRLLRGGQTASLADDLGRALDTRGYINEAKATRQLEQLAAQAATNPPKLDELRIRRSFARLTANEVQAKLDRSSLWVDRPPPGKGKFRQDFIRESSAGRREGQGSEYERLRDANIPEYFDWDPAENFPGVDDIRYSLGKGRATSYKTLDLRASSYANDTRALRQRVEKYIAQIIRFRENGARIHTFKGRSLSADPSTIDEYILDVAIPSGKASPDHVRELAMLRQEAFKQGIILRITEVP